MKFRTISYKYMNKQYILLLLLAGLMSSAFGQGKKISVKEIYQGAFNTNGLEVLRSMKNGKQYTVLNNNRSNRLTSIDKYDYRSLKKVETIVSSADSKEIPLFSSYAFSQDESKIILATEIESIFRRSTLGVFYVYDIANT
ncbi:MAG: S9 family peptidase, partial [Maribacter sp.]|nr:S9 family peptidase [Maribacter sp.]